MQRSTADKGTAMPYLKRPGQPTLYYEIDDYTDPWRQAPFILLQHGYGRYSRFWYSWVPYLSRYYRVLRPDMRGFGRSTQGYDAAGGFRFADLVEDVVAVMDAAGAGSVHYCGEAFGGTLGMQIAAEHPERIRTLSLISAPVFLPRKIQNNYALGEASWIEALRKHGIRKWAEATNTIARFPPHVDAGFLAWYSEELAKTDPETLVAFSNLCASYNMTDYLARIKAPVLGIYPRTRPEQVAVLREHLQHLDVVQIETDYLMIYNVHPGVCADAVLHFVSQHDGTICTE